MAGKQAGKIAVIGAQVKYAAGLGLRAKFLYYLFFFLQVFPAQNGILVVIAPGCFIRFVGREIGNDVGQMADHIQQLFLAESGGLFMVIIAGPGAGGSGMLQVNMQPYTQAQPAFQRQQLGHKINRYAIYIRAEYFLNIGLQVVLQVQGKQETLAKLPVGDPGLFGIVHIERKGVNKYRPPFIELNIVRRGIFQDHAML